MDQVNIDNKDQVKMYMTGWYQLMLEQTTDPVMSRELQQQSQCFQNASEKEQKEMFVALRARQSVQSEQITDADASCLSCCFGGAK